MSFKFKFSCKLKVSLKFKFSCKLKVSLKFKFSCKLKVSLKPNVNGKLVLKKELFTEKGKQCVRILHKITDRTLVQTN